MLDRAREMARSGARDQARELLSQMQNMLENLRAARPGEMQRGSNQAQQMMRGLQELMQRQQQLLDKSFRAQRQQGQPGQQDRKGQRGQPGDAIGPQTEALDQLQQAARDFAQQLRQRLGKGWGDPGDDEIGATDRDQRGRVERDPFGRPTSTDGTFDQGDVRIPDENTLQKSRQILDELRRRAGERSRPPIELDYIERLLKRF
jgi:hypothetical protein